MIKDLKFLLPGISVIQTTVKELEQCIVLKDVILGKTNIIETCILNMYIHSINFVLSDSRFDIKNCDIGLDIIANTNFNKGSILWKPSVILNISTKNLIEKYASYIYKDCFIIDGFGMLLNNKDERNLENCIFDENKHVFIATTSIKQGESIRMDYRMKTNDYPPIPEEIKFLRSTMVV